MATRRHLQLLVVIIAVASVVAAALFVGRGPQDASSGRGSATATTDASSSSSSTTTAGGGGSSSSSSWVATTSVPANGSVVAPAAVAAVEAQGRAPVIVSLDITPSGTESERAAQVRSALDRVLASLPAGSYSETIDDPTLPVVPLTVDRAGLDALGASANVEAVQASRIFLPVVDDSTTTSLGVASAGSMLPQSESATTVEAANAAWAAGKRGAGTTVAVIDSGVDLNHEYLRATTKSMWAGCFASAGVGRTSPCPDGVTTSPSADPVAVVDPTNVNDPGVKTAKPCPVGVSSNCSHGTHVAGIAVGGTGTPGTPVSGVAPAAGLVAVNVFSYSAATSSIAAADPDIMTALQWLYSKRALLNNLVTVNLSLGDGVLNTGACDSDPLKPYIDQLASAGISTVVAAGNSNFSTGVSSPACISSVLAVGSFNDAGGSKSPFSNIGPQVTVMAPGSNICSSVPISMGSGSSNCSTPNGTPMQIMSGTSMAAPAVAGAIAVLRSDGVTAAQVKSRLQRISSVNDCLSSSGFSIPKLRLDNALGLTATSGSCAAPPVATTTSTTTTTRPAPPPLQPNLPPGSPFGSLDAVNVGAGLITVTGWTIDPDTVAPANINLYIFTTFTDAVGYSLVANLPRGDIGAVFPGYGPAHGFTATVASSGGLRAACIVAGNVGAGDVTVIGCKLVIVPDASPIGSLDLVTAAPGSVSVAGWAFDPDASGPLEVQVLIFRTFTDAIGFSTSTGQGRPDVVGVYPAAGPNSGYSGTFPSTPGLRAACAVAVNRNSGSNSVLGCQLLIVP